MTERRLAAILVADVVGFARLVGADESGTLSRLAALRREVIDPLIAGHGGRVFKQTGDGFLVEFASAVQAVTCARAIQAKIDGGALSLRIGIHLGDVVVQGDDLMGDGVNIAARLEGIAEPGGVALSRQVHDQVRDRLDAAFVDKGEVTLKNIARPVHVFALGGKTSSDPLPVLALPDKPSIAVLPFQNMSGDPEQEYFADGVSEDIITELTRFRSLFVIARNSSFSYKGTSPDIREVGRELGVRYVLEGSIRKAGDRIRLTGQLIDAQTGSHIWAERYDRRLDDVFVVQEELTRSIVRAIAPQISEAELARVRRRRPENLTAYEISIRANATAWNAFARSDPKLCDEALLLARSALAIDPDNTTALAARLMAQGQQLWRGTAADRDATWLEANEAVARLLELEPSSSHGHIWKAHLHILRPAGPLFGDALAIARGAGELNPHDMTILIGLALVESLAGDPQRAIEIGQEALRISPRDPLRPHMRQQLTIAYFEAKRYEQAIDHAMLALAEAPRLPVHAYLAASHAALGQYDAAKSAFEAAQRAGPAYVESILAGTIVIATRPSGLKILLRVAAGLESRGAIEEAP